MTSGAAAQAAGVMGAANARAQGAGNLVGLGMSAFSALNPAIGAGLSAFGGAGGASASNVVQNPVRATPSSGYLM